MFINSFSILVGGFNPSENIWKSVGMIIKVSWDDYSQLHGKNNPNVPNHQPDKAPFMRMSHGFPVGLIVFPWFSQEFPRLWRIFSVPPHFNCRPTPSFQAVKLVRVVAKAEGDAPMRPGGDAPVGLSRSVKLTIVFWGNHQGNHTKPHAHIWITHDFSMKMLIAMNSSELLKWILPSGWWLSPTPLKTTSSSVGIIKFPTEWKHKNYSKPPTPYLIEKTW